MRNRYLIIHGLARDRYEVITMCGEALYKKGLISEQFGTLCVEREENYPTGLPTEIPTAIPHARDESITQNSVCFLELDRPVSFKRMDDDTQDVSTDMIFNLAIKDPNEHLQALQNMMGFLNDSEAPLKYKSLSDEELIEYLQEKIGQSGKSLSRKGWKRRLVMESTDIVTELKNASVQMPEEKIDQLIEAVDTHERISVYGTGGSGLTLKALAMRPIQMGYQSYVVGETTTPSMGKGDLLIVASAPGGTQGMCSAADDGAKQGTDMLVITGSKESTLSRSHEPLIWIEAATKFSELKASIQPLDGLFEQMLLLIFGAVILKMSSKSADTNKKMAKRHASIEQQTLKSPCMGRDMNHIILNNNAVGKEEVS